MINHFASILGLRSVALAAALLAGSALSAAASTITFNFTNTTANAGAGTESGSGVNNQRFYSAGGITLTVTAFSTTGPNGALGRANVGWHGSAGLGVCNANEVVTSCNSPTHQADNVGAQDFVLFQFSMPVDPSLVRIQPYGDNSSSTSGNAADRDVRYYINSAELALTTINGSLPSAVGSIFNDPSTVSSSGRDVTIAGGNIRTLLFGTPSIGSSSTSTPDSWGDFFKIHSITVDYVAPPGGATDPVPAPGAVVLLGSALAGLAVARRRRA